MTSATGAVGSRKWILGRPRDGVFEDAGEMDLDQDSGDGDRDVLRERFDIFAMVVGWSWPFCGDGC